MEENFEKGEREIKGERVLILGRRVWGRHRWEFFEEPFDLAFQSEVTIGLVDADNC